jgi:hypothetical protein
VLSVAALGYVVGSMSTATGTQWHLAFRRHELTFHYLLVRKPGPRLVVFFSSLRPPENTRPDYFNRVKWASELDCSCLYVADPGLQLRANVRGTWYQGTTDFYASERVAHDVRNIAREFDFDLAKSVLTGSSQGGFGALAVGAYLPGTRVMAEMPQTNVLLYEAKAEVARMARVCYFAATPEQIPQEFRDRYDLATLFAARGHVPPGLIVVKDSDPHHLDVHARPLIEQAKSPALRLEVATGDLGGAGHTPLPQGFVLERIVGQFG